jgi:hypothetical protein
MPKLGERYAPSMNGQSSAPRPSLAERLEKQNPGIRERWPKPETTSAIENVLASLQEVKPCGEGWSALCPAHDDGNASLSINVGDDGRVLMHCHAGCSIDEICEACGLKLADLFERSTSTLRNPENRREKPGFSSVETKTSDSTPGFPTIEAAIAYLEHRHGPKAGVWTYLDCEGEPIGVVVRWDTADGKVIRPISRRDDRWIIAGTPTPRPLYCLPEVIEAERVYVVEGEKAAEAGRSLSLTTTTSAFGAKSVSGTDWTPLAGKEVILQPDNDSAGEDYVSDVIRILAKLDPPPTLKIVRLDNLPEGGDLVDWLAAQTIDDRSALRKEIERLVDEADVVEVEPESTPSPYLSFPTSALPNPVRAYVGAAARAIGCDPTYVALPLLAALAAAIGNSRILRIKSTWTEPAVLWPIIIGPSGTAKSPAMEMAVEPIRRRDRKAKKDYEAAMAAYKQACLEYTKALQKGKHPKEPEEPVCERFCIDDTTIEALLDRLSENPRGLLVTADELSSWAQSFGQYKAVRGGDEAKWMQMHGAREVSADRKTGKKSTYVRRAAVSITGGIQPGILRKLLTSERFASGFAARLFMAMPPVKARRWSDAEIPPAIEKAVAGVFGSLLSVKMNRDDEGFPAPQPVTLSDAAKVAWVTYFGEHNANMPASEELWAAWSKLEGGAARLALIVHCARVAASDSTIADPNVVDEKSLASGVTIANWFKHEAERIYFRLHETAEQAAERRTIEWFERKDKPVTARDGQQSCPGLKESGAAERMFEALAVKGILERLPTPAGTNGRPTTRYRLRSVYATKPPESPEKT